MKIYMLLEGEDSSLFYSDDLEPADPVVEDPGPGVGLRARLLARWRAFHDTFQQADSGALGWCRRAWEWLHSRTQPDEPMLFRFRAASRIELHHPLSRDSRDVAAAWNGYLIRRRRRHRLRLIANLLIAPIAGLLLFPLPGPNLVGYWFAYRAIHHALLLGGIRRALAGRIPLSFHPEPWLDLPIVGNPWRSFHPAA